MPKQMEQPAPTDHMHDRGANKVSPLMLCDHLIQVAQEADQAGYLQTAAHLVALVDRMFDAHSPRR